MNVEVVPGREISGELARAWDAMHQGEPGLASPYFSPRFTQAVASVRDDAFVAVVSDAGRPVGFLPFQRAARGGAGRPIAGALSDYQAFIVRSGFDYDPRELIKSCGMSSFRYDHLLAAQTPFEPFHTARADSPVMDLSGGYEAYVEARKAAGSQEIRNLPRKARKLEREVGPIRFEVRSTSAADLATLRAWKTAQCLAVGGADVFEPAWTRELVDTIWHAPDTGDGFSGMFSTLHAGDTLVAAHFGMRSRTVWHWWFPVYSHEHGAYSPGIILLLKMAEVAQGLGLTVIDFGKGDNEYKQRMKTGSIPLAEGVVEVGSSTLGKVRRWAEKRAEAGGLGSALKLPLKVVRKIEHKRKFS